MHVLAHDRLEEEEEEKGATKPILLGGDRASEKELAEQFFVHDSRVRQAQVGGCEGIDLDIIVLRS